MSWPKAFVALIFLMGIASAYVGNSSSYTIGSMHQGLNGGEINSSSYTARSTMTYQQPGNSQLLTPSGFTANVGWYTVNYTITITNVSSIILYPPNGGAYGPSQCTQIVVVQTNDTAPAWAARSVTCRFYNWIGWANASYTLNGSMSSSNVNASFNFTIPQSSPPNWIINCTATINGGDYYTQNVSFTNVGNGPNFCSKSGASTSGDNSEVILFTTILGLLGVGYRALGAIL
jgi:hypothetical protein